MQSHFNIYNPVVCAAVYGTTTAYGQLATDTDMAGGGHQDHHPVLKGLQPDTLYQIRLQDVGPDGTLYVSDNLTFRTPSASAIVQPAKPQEKNVALISIGARASREQQLWRRRCEFDVRRKQSD